ncbi:metallophosphoesterase [Vibrio sp. PNB22_3_1]
MTIVKDVDLSHFSRLLAFGDIHGQYDLFLKSCKLLQRTPDTAVVSPGDLIDRGPKSYMTALHFLVSESAFATRGNHEQLLIDGFLKGSRESAIDHLMCGGEWIDAYHDDDLLFLATKLDELPHVLDVEFHGKRICFSHADIPTHSLNRFSTSEKRDILWNHKAHMRNGVASRCDLAVHGHKILREPKLVDNRLFLDTKAGGMNYDEIDLKHGLTCIEITPYTANLYTFYPTRLGIEMKVYPEHDRRIVKIRKLLKMNNN